MNAEANKQNNVTTALKIDVGMLAEAIDKLSWSLEDDEMSDPNNEHGSLPITCEEQVSRAKTVLADLRTLLPNYIPIVNCEPEFAEEDESTGGYVPLIATVTNTEVEPIKLAHVIDELITLDISETEYANKQLAMEPAAHKLLQEQIDELVSMHRKWQKFNV
jgi:hypothetical protein